MNWSRTKSIFIVIFLILNSFLGYQLWEKQSNQLEFTQIYESDLDEMLQLRDISIEIELSVDQPELAQLHVQYANYEEHLADLAAMSGQHVRFEKDRLVSELSEAYQRPEPFDPEHFEAEFMADNILYHDEYRFDRVTNQEIIYLQVYEDYPVFVAPLRFSQNEAQAIKRYQQVFFEVLSQGTKQSVLSAYTAVRTSVENQIIPTGSTVKDVTLGYYGQLYEVESQVLTPAWRVVVEHSGEIEEYYVNAFTGAIESGPTDES